MVHRPAESHREDPASGCLRAECALPRGRTLRGCRQLADGDRVWRGHPVSLTRDAGYFWFFDPNNVEVVVKVLDGCPVNGRRWVFAAGLTDVHVVLIVTDTQTGASKTYVNPIGTAFLPIQDTDAFSTCSAGSP